MNKILTLLLFFFMIHVSAQENIDYQKPPQEILDLVDVQIAPSVRIDEKSEYLILLSRDAYKCIEELSQEELRLGGLRIDPKTILAAG